MDEAQATITSTGFLKWVWYLEWLETKAQPTRLEYYLAQITAAVERAYAKNPKSVKVEDKLIHLQDERQRVDQDAYTLRSKSFWLSLSGVNAVKRRLPSKVKKGRKQC